MNTRNTTAQEIYLYLMGIFGFCAGLVFEVALTLETGSWERWGLIVGAGLLLGAMGLLVRSARAGDLQ